MTSLTNRAGPTRIWKTINGKKVKTSDGKDIGEIKETLTKSQEKYDVFNQSSFLKYLRIRERLESLDRAAQYYLASL